MPSDEDSGVDISTNSWNDDACIDATWRGRKLQGEICPLLLADNGTNIPLDSEECVQRIAIFCYDNFETDPDW